MLYDVARLLLDIEFAAILVMMFIYYLINAKGMFKVLVCFFAFGVFNRIIFDPLLNHPDAKYIWYIVWSTVNFVTMFIILKITSQHPNIKNVTIPISIFLVLLIFLEMFRHIERHYLETQIFKDLYSYGTPTLNWLIIAYLFAPIALFLVKFLRSRVLTNH